MIRHCGGTEGLAVTAVHRSGPRLSMRWPCCSYSSTPFNGGGLSTVFLHHMTCTCHEPVPCWFLVVLQGRGCISQPELLQRAGWQAERADQCLQQLLRDGMALIDDGAPDGVRLYWFPAVSSSGGSAGGGAGTGHSIGS